RHLRRLRLPRRHLSTPLPYTPLFRSLMDKPDAHLESAPVIVPAPALQAGFATSVDTRGLGLAVVALGGGRVRPQDTIDFAVGLRSEEHTSELQSCENLVCRLLLEKKN